jgi:hypothetical protein
MSHDDAFVSCSLCGAIFTGEVLPQHVCRHTGVVPTFGIFPTPTYLPPTLTLRDFFAASALTGVLLSGSMPGTTAERCYEIADAMMKERQKHEWMPGAKARCAELSDGSCACGLIHESD